MAGGFGLVGNVAYRSVQTHGKSMPARVQARSNQLSRSADVNRAAKHHMGMDLRGIFPEVWPVGRERKRAAAGFSLIAGCKYQPIRARISVRRRTEDSPMMTKHMHVKASPPAADAKEVEAAKVARLRALRLAKEAADREAAALAVAAAPPKSRRRRATQPAARAS